MIGLRSLLTCFLLIAGGAPFAKAAEPKCVNIFYDQSTDPSAWMGKTYAMLLQNLLGHFPEYQQVVSPVEFYRRGDIDHCHATFYIGSHFDNGIPAAFFEDLQKTQSRFAWLGYNLWNLGPEALAKIFGAKYVGLTGLNTEILDAKKQPTFFKDVLYKGEVFSKYGRFRKDAPTEFVAPFEMIRVEPTEPGSFDVVAQARHNGTGEILPYIIRRGNTFYVADVPFSFMHEADRYLVFCDVLFDILGAEPRHKEHYAFLRLEDIHPLVPLSYLYSALETLEREQVPANISVIPLFFDPLNQFSRDANQEFVSLTQVPEFLGFLRDAEDRGGAMIWHGATHQLGVRRNPHSGVSGDDFEFWDAIRGTVLAEDSADFVIDRLDSGFYDLRRAGLEPSIWLTPHYQASPLDYMIFGRVFPWNVGRVIYFNHHVTKTTSAPSEADLWYTVANDTPAGRQRRLDWARGIDVTMESDRWTGQIFPYEIFGDVYGQRILPENLGNSQPTENSHVVQPRSVQEIIADAKRNLVIRDAWGSFFYHVQLFNIDENGGRGAYPGDTSELSFLVREMKKLGYQFINLNDYVKNQTVPLRPEPQYRTKATP